MNNYIKAQTAIDAVADALMEWSDMEDWRDKKVIDAITDAPRSDVRENRTGEWKKWYETIKHENYDEHILHCMCPNCEKEYDYYGAQFMRFCPNCGADMRGDSDV